MDKYKLKKVIKDFEIGVGKEKDFWMLLNYRYGCDYQPANETQNKYGHYDGYSKRYLNSIEFKGIKKCEYIPDKKVYTELFCWIEIIGNTGNTGWIGWLFGLTKTFIFELDDFWVAIDSNILRDFIYKKIQMEIVYNHYEALYKLFDRKYPTEKSLTTLITKDDLLSLKNLLIAKDPEKDIILNPFLYSDSFKENPDLFPYQIKDNWEFTGNINKSLCDNAIKLYNEMCEINNKKLIKNSIKETNELNERLNLKKISVEDFCN